MLSNPVPIARPEPIAKAPQIGAVAVQVRVTPAPTKMPKPPLPTPATPARANR